MNINTIKDLEALMKLCRKHNIEAFEIGDIKFSLGAPLVRHQAAIKSEDPLANAKVPLFNGITNPAVAQTVADVIKTDELTQEQLLFYSSADRIEEKAE